MARSYKFAYGCKHPFFNLIRSLARVSPVKSLFFVFPGGKGRILQDVVARPALLTDIDRQRVFAYFAANAPCADALRQCTLGRSNFPGLVHPVMTWAPYRFERGQGLSAGPRREAGEGSLARSRLGKRRSIRDSGEPTSVSKNLLILVKAHPGMYARQS